MLGQNVRLQPCGAGLDRSGDAFGANTLEASVFRAQDLRQRAPCPVTMERKVEPQASRQIQIKRVTCDRTLQVVNVPRQLQQDAPLRVWVAAGLAVVAVLLAVDPADLPKLRWAEVPPLFPGGLEPPR